MNVPAPDVRPRERRVSGAVLRTLHRCERRLHLDYHAPDAAGPEGDHASMLRERAIEHERRVRDQFPGTTGPIRAHFATLEEAADETLRLIRESRATLHRPVFLSPRDGASAIPDLVYWEDDGLVVHAAKLATRLQNHDEIRAQLTHEAVVIEEVTGLRPRIEITSGRFEVLPVEPLPEPRYQALRGRAQAILDGGPEPDLLRAHSECEHCPYYRHCWSSAEDAGRLEVVRGLRRTLLPTLRAIGVHTVADLAAIDPDRLREIPSFAESADVLIGAATAARDRSPVWIQNPQLPAGRPIVWLDLEAASGAIGDDTIIYLWGLSIDDGADEPAVEMIWGDLAPGGDVAGWHRFLARAEHILAHHPEAIWVHYANFERTWIQRYAERYGDPGLVASRVLASTFDLLEEALEPCVHLPLRSLSIKHVAPYTGFSWSDPEAGSTWSMAQYRKACETGIAAERDALLARIAAYNRDDLGAMRSVWRWLEHHAPGGTQTAVPPAIAAPPTPPRPIPRGGEQITFDL
jgi:predicted RecB family nuclease